MKTQEEIEIFAQLKYGRCNEEIVDSFCDGYTQCQQDNTEKKYTEEDMIKFANQYSSINILHLKEHLKEFTLNKQD
jgi:hypothetical protein